MTLKELQETDWYKSRPEIIRQAIDARPPIQMYSLGGKQCKIHSIEEPESDKFEDVTFTVEKTGVGGIAPFADAGWKVFGVKVEDLRDWVEDNEDEKT